MSNDLPDTGVPAARLDFRVDPTVPTILDGAWWPRTRDTVSELAALVVALDARHAPLGLIMLNPAGWLGHPRRIEAGGRTVRVAWFVDLDRAVLTATTIGRERIDLLVAADDDPADTALTALIVTGDDDLVPVDPAPVDPAPVDRAEDREGRAG